MKNTRTLARQPARKSNFKLQDIDPEATKRRGQRSGGNWESPFLPQFAVYRPKPGPNAVRILPPTWANAEHYGLEVYVHKRIGAIASDYMCPKKTLINGKPISKKCPVCAMSDALYATGDKQDKEEAYKWSGREHYVYWVMNRDAEKGDDEDPQIYIVSRKADTQIAAAATQRSGKIIKVSHPELGQDLIIHRQGQVGDRNTTYSYSFDPLTFDEESGKVQRQYIAVDEQRAQEVLDYIAEHPLDTVLKFKSPEELQTIMDGTAMEEDEDAGSDDDQRRGRGRASSRDNGGQRARRGAAEEDEGDEETTTTRRGRATRDEGTSSRVRRTRAEAEDDEPQGDEDEPGDGEDTEYEQDDEDGEIAEADGDEGDGDEDGDDNPLPDEDEGDGEEPEEPRRPARAARGRDDRETRRAAPQRNTASASRRSPPPHRGGNSSNRARR